MDLIGALSSAAGAGGAAEGAYIEDVFSTYLYAGTGAVLTITNGIDLDGEGGLVWIKDRDVAYDHFLCDTERGVLFQLKSNTTQQQNSRPNSVTAFNSNGFSIDSYAEVGSNAEDYVSWTFRKAEKFFDIVTWTGNGANRTISHNLGAVPGCIMVKAYSGATANSQNWAVYHRANTANPETDYLVLNTTDATADSNTRWNDTLPTDSVFSLGTDATVNASGNTYVAYLFAHDAGGFGDDGEQNVISCGSFTTDGSGNATVTLGYEPQLGIAKASSGTSTWVIIDNMRGMTTAGIANAQLFPNTSAAEASGSGYFNTTSTGFTFTGGGSSVTWIYIAIRRGPMKTPTAGTEVFAVDIGNSSGTTGVPEFISGFPVDGVIDGLTTGSIYYPLASARLIQGTYLTTSSTAAEDTSGNVKFDFQNGYWSGTASSNRVAWMFRRAPGFFDVVAYTGDGVRGRTVAHNLGVVPELMFIKNRQDVQPWLTYVDIFGGTKRLFLNQTNALDTASIDDFNNTDAEADVFTLGNDGRCNANNQTFVAYLFASLAGVSKVGSYTGTGTTLAIDCGFSAGARFVMIKRTDSTGDWYVWDSARGISASSDPYILLNSTAAEVTGTDYIDPSSAGFEISSSAPAAINASGGSFLFYAVA